MFFMMKQVLKKLTPFVLALVMLVVLGTYVKADTADEAAEAAALLGVSRPTLYAKLKKYNI